MSRADAYRRVSRAIELGDFTDVTATDLKEVNHPVANSQYRAWVDGGCNPLPLTTGNDCVDEVLVRVEASSGLDGHFRYVIEHHELLNLQPGDLVFVRRARPLPDPERRRG